MFWIKLVPNGFIRGADLTDENCQKDILIKGDVAFSAFLLTPDRLEEYV